MALAMTLLQMVSKIIKRKSKAYDYLKLLMTGRWEMGMWKREAVGTYLCGFLMAFRQHCCNDILAISCKAEKFSLLHGVKGAHFCWNPAETENDGCLPSCWERLTNPDNWSCSTHFSASVLLMCLLLAVPDDYLSWKVKAACMRCLVLQLEPGLGLLQC